MPVCWPAHRAVAAALHPVDHFRGGSPQKEKGRCPRSATSQESESGGHWEVSLLRFFGCGFWICGRRPTFGAILGTAFGRCQRKAGARTSPSAMSAKREVLSEFINGLVDEDLRVPSIDGTPEFRRALVVSPRIPFANARASASKARIVFRGDK